MGWLRRPGRILGVLLLVALLIPSLATVPASIIDRGPDGSPRCSAFPMALTVFDPFVWTCVRNSVVVAATVAIGSIPLGVGLAMVAGGRRFRARASLWALAMTPVAAGPLLIGAGLACCFGGDRGWDWLTGRPVLGISGEVLVRWASLAWTGLAIGVPLVAMMTLAAIRRVDPSWSEAARAVGASRQRAWRDVAWPIIRPEVARASAMVFTLVLVEPAGPIVFSLRRTLAVQILDAAIRLDQPTRASALALIAVVCSMIGRTLIRWWGGPSYARFEPMDARPTPSLGFRSAWASRFVLMGWAGLAFGPVAMLLWRTFEASRASSPDSWSRWFERWWLDPELPTWGANSMITAGLAVVVNLAILRHSSGPMIRAVGRASRIIEAIPPLALSVGALATPWLLLVLADLAASPIEPWLRSIARELSPARSPGFLLIMVLAAVQLPMLASVSATARRGIKPVLADAERIMGRSDRRASRVGEGRWLGLVTAGPAFLAFALASTSLAPALLLTPFSERRTLATGAIGLILETEPISSRVFGPIAAILGINLLAFAFASRRQVESREV